MTHFHIERKRAAVEVFHSVKRLRTENGAKWLSPLALASVAAGGASQSRVYEWLSTDLTTDAQEERRGAAPTLSDDLEKLLIGFAVHQRSSLEHLTLASIQQFCKSYLTKEPSLSTLSRIMSKYGFSSQKAMARNSRMVSQDVVEDALSFIEEIRAYDFPPHRVICMDETGLWSNVTQPKTYHFKNWCANPLSST